MTVRYFWIRDVAPRTHMRLLALARARHRSLSDVAAKLVQRYADQYEPPLAKNRRSVAAARKPRVKMRKV